MSTICFNLYHVHLIASRVPSFHDPKEVNKPKEVGELQDNEDDIDETQTMSQYTNGHAQGNVMGNDEDNCIVNHHHLDGTDDGSEDEKDLSHLAQELPTKVDGYEPPEWVEMNPEEAITQIAQETIFHIIRVETGIDKQSSHKIYFRGRAGEDRVSLFMIKHLELLFSYQCQLTYNFATETTTMNIKGNGLFPGY